MTSVAVVVPAVGCACSQLDAFVANLQVGDAAILVVNGTPPHDCAAGRSREGVPVKAMTLANHPLGASAARNAGAGVALADHDVLAFLDADDAADHRWRTELAAALDDPGVDVVAGAIAFRVGDEAPRIVTPGVEYWLRPGLFGGNVALRTAAWSRLGGFDTGLAACEDTDLAWRAAELGMTIAVSPSMLVEVLSRTPGSVARQRLAWGWWATALIHKHGVCDSHLPSLTELLRHKRRDEFTSSWFTAGLAQWIGQKARAIRPSRLGVHCACPVEGCARCRGHQRRRTRRRRS